LLPKLSYDILEDKGLRIFPEESDEKLMTDDETQTSLLAVFGLQ